MKFEKVDYIPESYTRKTKKPVRDILDAFMAMQVKYVRVVQEDGDYASPGYARASLSQGIVKYDYPIQLKYSNGELYLIRTDI